MALLRFLVLILAAGALAAYVLAVRRIVKRENSDPLRALLSGTACAMASLAVWWLGLGLG